MELWKHLASAVCLFPSQQVGRRRKCDHHLFDVLAALVMLQCAVPARLNGSSSAMNSMWKAQVVFSLVALMLASLC